MKRFYSQTTQTTYLQGLHADIPADAVEISEELFLSVIGNPGPGKTRAHDDQGLPYLVNAPAPAIDLAATEREWRDAELSAVMWLRERHRDQLEIGVTTSLMTDQFNELLAYMQTLRDWPQAPEFPDSKHRPIAPAWIAQQVE